MFLSPASQAVRGLRSDSLSKRLLHIILYRLERLDFQVPPPQLDELLDVLVLDLADLGVGGDGIKDGFLVEAEEAELMCLALDVVFHLPLGEVEFEDAHGPFEEFGPDEAAGLALYVEDGTLEPRELEAEVVGGDLLVLLVESAHGVEDPEEQLGAVQVGVEALGLGVVVGVASELLEGDPPGGAGEVRGEL